MVTTVLLLQAAELVGWSGLFLHAKKETSRRILIHGSRPQSIKIPIADTYLKKLSGHPTMLTRKIASGATGAIRKIVQTKSFEYLVLGMFNKRSKLRAKFRKKPALGIL